MKKIILYVIGVLVVVGGIALYLFRPTNTIPQQVFTNGSIYKNAVYIVDGKPVQLVNGMASTEVAPGSASKIATQYFGNEVRGDLNGDGAEDVAFILTQNTGGSGTFYYVVAALGSNKGYIGTNAVLLGDRIAPQTTEFRDGEIIVNYADRAPGEPMVTPPSVGMSKYLKISNGTLVVAR